MTENRDLFERAVDAEYESRVEESAPFSDVKRRIVTRGRRRRATRSLGGIALAGVAVLGVSFGMDAINSPPPPRPAPANAPAIGAEKVMGFGGPMAASDEALYVANGNYSNDAGDKQSIARFDFGTRKVRDTDPTSMPASKVALGSAGLWIVGWGGDLPLNGDPDRAEGGIQLVDPDSGEVLIDIPREGSAPYDVAAGDVDGHPIAWVVDAGREELLEVDGETGAVETLAYVQRPNDVLFAEGFVWATSNLDSQGILTRFNLDGGSVAVKFDHCLNDLVAHEGSIWAVDFCGDAIHRFDPTTLKKQATVRMGSSPSAIAVFDGLLWVHRENEIVRVDPDAARIVGDPIHTGEEHSIDPDMVAAADGVYVSSFGGAVYRLAEGLPVREPAPTPKPEPEETSDALTSETCGDERVMCIPLDREWSMVGAGFGSAWVANIGEGDTFGTARFDAESGEETDRLATDGFVQGFAPDDRWMWALVEASTKNRLLQIDPDTTSVVNTYDMGDTGNVGKASIAAGGGYVWVSQPNGRVARLSIADGDVTTESYADVLPGYGVASGPLSLAYGEERLWLSYGKGHLGVVDPASGRLERVEEKALRVNAYQIVVAQGLVWSPHQDVEGTNVLSYASTTEGERRGYVVLEQAVPSMAATDGTNVWVVQDAFNERDNDWLIQIDAATRNLRGDPLKIDTAFQGTVAAGDGYAWVAGNRVLYRVEAEP